MVAGRLYNGHKGWWQADLCNRPDGWWQAVQHVRQTEGMAASRTQEQRMMMGEQTILFDR
jgi:hypothetical protein